jgi:ATP-dependent Clp protease protease subunit
MTLPGWRPGPPPEPGWQPGPAPQPDPTPRPGPAPQRPGWLPGDPQQPPAPLPPAVGYLEPHPDLADQLWRRRVVLLSGRLDYPTAEAAIARVLLADADGPEPIQLHVHCPDGDLDAAVVLAETLQLVRARVVALASGTVGGPVVGAYAAARVRRAHPNARFALTEPRAAFHGRGSRIAADVDLQADQLRFLQRTIAEATGLDPADVATDMQDSRVLTAEQAARLGLVHEIIIRPA